MTPSQRLAFNLGFQKRAAEILMVKEANRMKTLLRAGQLGPASLERISKTYGVPVDKLQAMKGFQASPHMVSAGDFTSRSLNQGVGRQMGDHLAGSAPERLLYRRGMAAGRASGAASAGAAASANAGGFNIPQRSGWGADNINKATGALWNNRTNPQRAGIVGAGVYGYGAHERARAQQAAYDQFAEAHPIMAGLGRFMGVNRPGYGQALANNALYLPGIS